MLKSGKSTRSAAAFGLIISAFFSGWPLAAHSASALVPERRVIVMPDTDFPGGDLDAIFETSFEQCQHRCLADANCAGLTYNQKSRACFPKRQLDTPELFVGAVSAQMLDNTAARAQAESRAAAADWLAQGDLDAALDLARGLAVQYPPLDSEDPLYDARQAADAGEQMLALRYYATATLRSDSADDWLSMAEYAQTGPDNGFSATSAVVSMALNAYLRAGDDETAAGALYVMARAWEDLDRGRDALKALRLAAGLSANPTIAEALALSEERNGFRVTDTEIRSDSASPEFCAEFSEDLKPGLDYTPYIRVQAPDVTVSAQDRQLCLGGLSHGQKVEMVARAGLPAASGETLARDVPLTGYLRDRAAAVRFPGRAYVLPMGGDQGLTIETVNTDRVALRLMQVSDRNLIRAMRGDVFARPLDHRAADSFNDSMATEIWAGEAEIAGSASDRLNKDVETRLAIPAEAGPLEPGIYVLEATVPGTPPRQTGVAAQWFVITDLGISTLWGADGLVTVLRGLGDAGAKSGVEVTLLSRANAILARTQTDDEGVARFEGGVLRGQGEAAPALVMATIWDGEGAERVVADMAFLSLSEPEFDLSDRGVEGLPPAPPIDVFMTLDRGAYRTGEVINVTAMARDATARALDDLPMTAILYRPDGVEASRQVVPSVGAGGYVLSFAIAENAPRGTWRIDLRAEEQGPALASARALVEDFMPERLDFALGLPEGPLRAGENIALSLDANWLYGAPAAGLPVEARLMTTPARSLPGFAGVVFGRHDADPTPEYETLPEAMTDAQGQLATTIEMPRAAAASLRNADLVVSLREGAGRPVERRETRLVMPDIPAIGVKPLFEDGVVAEGTEARFELFAARPDLSPAELPVKWVLNRIETDYQWYAVGGRWNWEPVTRRHKVDAGEGLTGQTSLALPVGWGEYELVVTAPDGSAAEASLVFDAGWGASAGAGTQTPDRLDVTLDQPSYRAGDRARVHIKAREAGQAIVSVLTNRVVSLEIVKLRAGENTIKLPVTEEWGAGAYVTVSALRPLDGERAPEQGTSRAPTRALGLAYAAVASAERALEVEIDAAAEATPRGTLPVTLKVQGARAGEPVFATLAAVDQGILNLTGFASPDPSQHYFGQRRLGVGLRDLYGRLILPTGAPDGVLRQGGDAGAEMGIQAAPPTEELMSWFSGVVQTGADGTITLEVPLPDFNGELRLMAVAWSKTAIGQDDAVSVIRDPVVMTVTAPRFLSPGDQAQVTLALTHISGPTGEVGLAVADTGDAALSPGALPASVTLGQQERVSLTLPVSAGDEGLGKLQLTLTTPSGAQLDKQITVPVSLAEPDQMRQARMTIAPGETLPIDPALTAGLMADARLSVTAGPFAALDVAGAMGMLSRYPYGCTEQITSMAMPLLTMPELAASFGTDAPTETRTQVQHAIERVLLRQAPSGSFGLWAPDTGDLWLDAYVTEFLSRARQDGYDVPERAFAEAISHLQNEVNYATDPLAAEDDENAALAYAVNVLAQERAATIGDLRYYADAAAQAFRTPLAAAQIGQALASYGDQVRAAQMFARAHALLGAGIEGDEAQLYRGDYGSALRDHAAVLALASETGSAEFDLSEATRALATRIAQRNQQQGGVSTQEAAWIVRAAAALGRGTPEVSVDGQKLAAVVADLSPAAQQVANTGRAPVEVTLTAFGKSRNLTEAGGAGYGIRRSYFTLEGAPVDPALVRLGTRMVVVVEVQPYADGEGDGGRLMVTDPLPAGFEIDNPNLIRSGEVAALDWLDDLAEPEATQFLHDRFNAAITWFGGESFRLAYMVRAVSEGQFRHPAASVEDMYRPQYRGWSQSGVVQVTP